MIEAKVAPATTFAHLYAGPLPPPPPALAGGARSWAGASTAPGAVVLGVVRVGLLDSIRASPCRALALGAAE